MRSLCLAVLLLIGCSAGDDESTGAVHNQINQCATKGATYLQQVTEHPGGTCGKMPDQIINMDDPSITAPICAAVTQQECVARGTACKTSSNGCTSTMSYMTTFAADGSSATGTATISIECNDGSYCTSTYDAKMTRQ